MWLKYVGKTRDVEYVILLLIGFFLFYIGWRPMCSHFIDLQL